MTINSTIRKAGPFIGNGTTTVFPFAFKVFIASDLLLVKLTVSTSIETTLVLTTDYTVTLNQDQDSNPGGTVTLVAGALAAGFNLVVTSNLPELQQTDLTNQGGFYPDVINDALDRATIQIQQLQVAVDRAALVPITSTVSTASLVADIVRLAASAANLDINANNIASINTVAADLNEPVSEIDTVATNITNVNTVGTNIANVNTVAGISANVTTVAGISANVTTVATNSASVVTAATNIANINTVASDLNEPVSEIDTVATNIANVNTVGTNISSVNTTATNIANVNAVGSDLLEPVSEINTVAVDITNVNNVGNNISNVNTVAGISANVTTVAGISANVTTVAGISGAVSNVSSISSAVSAVNSNATNVNTVAGISANVTTVAGIAANVSTVAGISANVTSVAGIAANVTTVAGISANVTTVSGISANVTTVATNDANVTTVATNIADINTNATNIVDIQNAAENAQDAIDAKVAAEAAQAAAELARDQAYYAAGVYQDTATALAATTNGDYFSVASAGTVYMTLYRNDAGSATLINTLYGAAKIDEIEDTQAVTTFVQAAAISQLQARTSTPFVFPA
jgi:hypothetical protein